MLGNMQTFIVGKTYMWKSQQKRHEFMEKNSVNHAIGLYVGAGRFTVTQVNASGQVVAFRQAGSDYHIKETNLQIDVFFTPAEIVYFVEVDEKCNPIVEPNVEELLREFFKRGKMSLELDDSPYAHVVYSYYDLIEAIKSSDPNIARAKRIKELEEELARLRNEQ